MASQLESTMDAPVTNTDATSGSQALISEVNSDRAAGKTDTRSADQSQTQKINDTFGSLTIFGDDSKDTAPAVKTTGDGSSSTAASGASDASTSATDASTSTTDLVKPASDTSSKTNDLAAAAPADATVATTPVDAASAVKAADLTAKVSPEVSAASPADATTSAPSDTASGASLGDGATAKGGAGNNGDGSKDVASAPDAADVNADALKKIQDDPQVKAEAKKLNDDITKHEKGLDKSSDEYQRLETMRQNMDVLEKEPPARTLRLDPKKYLKHLRGLLTSSTPRTEPMSCPRQIVWMWLRKPCCTPPTRAPSTRACTKPAT